MPKIIVSLAVDNMKVFPGYWAEGCGSQGALSDIRFSSVWRKESHPPNLAMVLPNWQITYSLASLKLISAMGRLGHVNIILPQCVPDIVFICSWHYLETIKATISGHCAATQRNGWCWWSVKHTMTNFYLASRASYWLQTIAVFTIQTHPNHNQIFKWWFLASNFPWNIPWPIYIWITWQGFFTSDVGIFPEKLKINPTTPFENHATSHSWFVIR